MRVAIAGAGNVGRSIALELLEHGHDVLLIEREPAALKRKTVYGAQWVHGDACEVATLEEAPLRPAWAFEPGDLPTPVRRPS